MDNVINKYRNTFNLVVLATVLVLQILGLAFQVQRPSDGGTRLVRVWAIGIVTPFTRGIVHSDDWFSNGWRNYIWLRGVRKENEELKDQIAQMRMQQIRLVEDANQAHRLQSLLGFKEQYISQSVPAQVISTTGSEFSRAVYIDKGSKDGIKPDMPVVTPEGIVGKVLRVISGNTSMVLLISDPTSGAGVILEKSRLQGILKGSASGVTAMNNVMSDEKVEPGERILTSGGDRIFPKGMPVGTVASVGTGQDLFLNIRVKPAANLSRLEEVLVITRMDERAPDAVAEADGPRRAFDILAQRLPTVAPPAPDKDKSGDSAKTTPGTNASAVASSTTKPKAGAIENAAAKKTLSDAVTEKPKPVKPASTGPAASKPAAAVAPETAKDAQPQ
jgi:rod shape-determining protein MreC